MKCSDIQVELHHALGHECIVFQTNMGIENCVVLLCRNLLLSRPFVGKINSQRHSHIKTADALMLCRHYWTYRRQDAKHRSGMRHCIAKNILKANKRKRLNKHFPRGCTELLTKTNLSNYTLQSIFVL